MTQKRQISSKLLLRQRPVFPVLCSIAVGLLIVMIYAMGSGLAAFLITISAGWITAGASISVGALLGFLFGIPRVLTSENAGGQNSEPTQAIEHELPKYKPNTNLEQISDWLTKILVGIGLASLSELSVLFANIVDYVGPSMGDGPHVQGFVSGLIIYHVIVGFFVGYLWTRISLSGEFRLADIKAQKRAKAEVEKELDDLPEDEDPVLEGEQPKSATEMTAAARSKVVELGERVRQLNASGESFNAQAYRKLARELKAVKEYTAAEEAYLKAYEVDHSDPAPLNYAGALRSIYMEDYDGAEQLYRQALAVDPAYVSPLYNMACNEARRAKHATDDESRQGHFNSALNLLAAAIAGDPKYKKMAINESTTDRVFEQLSEDKRFQDLVS